MRNKYGRPAARLSSQAAAAVWEEVGELERQIEQLELWLRVGSELR